MRKRSPMQGPRGSVLDLDKLIVHISVFADWLLLIRQTGEDYADAGPPGVG